MHTSKVGVGRTNRKVQMYGKESMISNFKKMVLHTCKRMLFIKLTWSLDLDQEGLKRQISKEHPFC